MPITLVTGTPGHGKTLFVVGRIFGDLVDECVKEGRRIYTNIPLQNLTDKEQSVICLVTNDDLLNWPQWENCLIIIDECQDIFPPRSSGARVPDHVSMLNKHRHGARDMWVITQHPSLVDFFLKNLVDEHYHVRRPSGFSYSVVQHWPMLNPNPSPTPNRLDGVKSRLKFPKEMFAKYRSASGHTIKAKIPWRLLGLTFGAISALLLTVGFAYQNFVSMRQVASGGSQVENVDQVSACRIMARTSSGYFIRQGGQVFRVVESELPATCS